MPIIIRIISHIMMPIPSIMSGIIRNIHHGAATSRMECTSILNSGSWPQPSLMTEAHLWQRLVERSRHVLVLRRNAADEHLGRPRIAQRIRVVVPYPLHEALGFVRLG